MKAAVNLLWALLAILGAVALSFFANVVITTKK